MPPHSLLSVGIDVGTTTTQVVFSRLTVQDTARAGQVPRIGITDKAVLYQSPVFFTPLADWDTVDAARLTEQVRREYALAGIEPAQVETGAVIITGETAKKKNADEILRALAGLAGEFVVTVAGPHLESLIAGRGSGAEAISRKEFTTVSNVDIGGGSANLATFYVGEFKEAAAMNYGGRILEIDRATRRVRHLAEPAKAILADLGLTLSVGDTPDLGTLRRFTDRMADLTVELIEGGNSPLAQKLYLTPPIPANRGHTSAHRGYPIMYSGGIGQYFYDPVPFGSIDEVAVHDDVGPLLAESLRQNNSLRLYKTWRPIETMRATVLGASSQTVTLSGSTIWAEPGLLPLRNVPVVRPRLAAGWQPAAIASAVAEAARRWDINLTSDYFAVALELNQPLDYTLLLQLATGLHEFSNLLPPGRPLIAIIERDYAQALGQTVKAMAPGRPLLVIDQVGLAEGDYIDIGAPLMDGRVVPLSVKTLVFYH